MSEDGKPPLQGGSDESAHVESVGQGQSADGSRSSADDGRATGESEAGSGSSAALDFDLITLMGQIEERNKIQLEDYRKALDDSSYPDLLADCGRRYLSKTDFIEGELITWKPNLKSMPFPIYGAPAVFVRKLSEGDVPSEKERIDQDCLIGYLDGDWEFRVVRANSRRFDSWSTLG